MFNKVIQKIGKTHAKIFGYVSEKAKTSKWWAIALTFLVIYELVEHIVYPILVPYLAYHQWFK
jgi:hypothetical protein